jgi:NTP pyrophosphatase (non-canonical NTP hydrolase)
MKKDLEKILKFREKRDWKQFHSPKNLAISLAVETSEILEIFQWTKNNKVPKEKIHHLSEELADVYYFVLLLAHESGIDLNQAFNDKMKINEKKYPVDKARGSSKKYTEYND